MKDQWKPFKEVDFNDQNINHYHLDTRDFCCIPITNMYTDKDFTTVIKYPDRFIYSSDEVVNLINMLFVESGGDGDWRMLSLDTINTYGWQLKYLRIYRVKQGLIVCNSDSYALRKEFWKNKVNKKYLNHCK